MYTLSAVVQSSMQLQQKETKTNTFNRAPFTVMAHTIKLNYNRDI